MRVESPHHHIFFREREVAERGLSALSGSGGRSFLPQKKFLIFFQKDMNI